MFMDNDYFLECMYLNCIHSFFFILFSSEAKKDLVFWNMKHNWGRTLKRDLEADLTYPRTHMWTWVIGTHIQNYEIWYLKWIIVLQKSILNGFYQNLAHMCQKVFSADDTTFEATWISFTRVNLITKEKKAQKRWS